MPTVNLGREPVAIITAFIVALGALNTQVPGLSPTIHNAIAAALVVLGALVARAAVTPAAPAPTVWSLPPTSTSGTTASASGQFTPLLPLAVAPQLSVAELLARAQAAEAATAHLATPSPAPAPQPTPEPGPTVSP